MQIFYGHYKSMTNKKCNTLGVYLKFKWKTRAIIPLILFSPFIFFWSPTLFCFFRFGFTLNIIFDRCFSLYVPFSISLSLSHTHTNTLVWSSLNKFWLQVGMLFLSNHVEIIIFCTYTFLRQVSFFLYNGFGAMNCIWIGMMFCVWFSWI